MTTTTETTKVLTRDMPDRSRIVATLSVERGYFSLCGELYEPHGTWSGAARQRNGRDMDAAGQITEELSRAFPNLEPFARMHLSDAQTGEPMHALANGWYWYRQGDIEAVKRTLRVDDVPPGLAEANFAAFVDDQRSRWSIEAREALALLDSLA